MRRIGWDPLRRVVGTSRDAARYLVGWSRDLARLADPGPSRSTSRSGRIVEKDMNAKLDVTRRGSQKFDFHLLNFSVDIET